MDIKIGYKIPIFSFFSKKPRFEFLIKLGILYPIPKSLDGYYLLDNIFDG